MKCLVISYKLIETNNPNDIADECPGTTQLSLSDIHALTRYGYIVALQYLLRVRAGGLLFGGLPCSLHVWMSRGTSKKTRANPRGLLGEGLGFAADCVRVANLIAARYAIMALICLVRSIFWLTEQPSSSVAQFLPYIVHALHPDQMMVGFAGAVIQRMSFGIRLDFLKILKHDHKSIKLCWSS